MIRNILGKCSTTLSILAILSAAAASAQPTPPQPLPPTPAVVQPQPTVIPTAPPTVNATWIYAGSPRQVVVYWSGLETKTKATFMGIGVDTPTETLRSQLKLAEGTGLVVNYIDDKGPSKDLIHKHDVLRKIDDQLMINGEQLQVLVRMHKPGDTIHATVIRESKAMVIEIKLAEKEIAATANDTDISRFAFRGMSDDLASANGIPSTQPVNYTATTMGAGGGWAASGVTTENRSAQLSNLQAIYLADTVAGWRPVQPHAEAYNLRLGDRATIIRRLTLDLTGAVPTPEEVKAFVDDNSPNAYENLINRLLANAPVTFVQPTTQPANSRPPVAEPAK